MIRLVEKPDVVEIIKRAQLSSRPVNPPDLVKAGLIGLLSQDQAD